MTEYQNKELKQKGYTIIRNLIDEKWIDVLSLEMDKAFLEHRDIQKNNKNEIDSSGVALHVLLSSFVFLEFLQYLLEKEFIQSLSKNFFKSKCILNSFSALNNLSGSNFSSIIHRDLRFYSGDFPIMINCLIMVDDFTSENGGTYLLSGSHLEERKPSDEEFFNKAHQVTGKRGDILIFNSKVWHCSAPNKTEYNRRALPFTISRSFMKQLLDYPRALGYEKMDLFSDELKQFLGYYSRVPSSLEEWYQPEENRFYKKYQD